MSSKVEERLKQALVVDSDGNLLVWKKGKIYGDYDLVKEIKIWSRLGRTIKLTPFSEPTICVWDDPENVIGALAALFSAHPSRTRILQAPEYVLTQISDDYVLHNTSFIEETLTLLTNNKEEK